MWGPFWEKAEAFGADVGQVVLLFASLLRQEYAPGLVCVGLVVALAFVGVRYYIKTRNILKAIKTFAEIVERAPDAEAFQRSYIDLSSKLHALEKPDLNTPASRLGTAWREYAETLEESSANERIYNSVRPSSYFNREDLGIEDGFWRHVPALFVSVGLFLTFLGLVAALDTASETLQSATGGSEVGTTGALTDLLSVASAKFIMSLTGLLCSILFTVELRGRTGKIDDRLLRLCNAIEKRVLFRTPESLLAMMLIQQERQTEQMKGLLPELVAQLGRPLQNAAEQQSERLASMENSLTLGLQTLNEGVPTAIQNSMQPIMERLEQNLGSTTKDIADGLSGQLTAGMRDSLEEMGRTMGKVSQSLSVMAERMDSSSNNMAGQVDAAVAALAAQIGELSTQMAASSGEAAQVLNNGTERLLSRMDAALAAIQQNTVRGGETLERAAQALHEAAAEIAAAIQKAGEAAAGEADRAVRGAGEQATRAMGEGLTGLVEGLAKAMHEVEGQTGRFAEAFRGDLLTPLEELQGGLNRWREAIQGATAQSQRHADAVSNSAGAIELANGEISKTTEGLARATGPMAEAAGRIEASNRELVRMIEAAANAMELALQGVQEPQRAMHQAINSLETAVDDFSNIVNRYQDIDSALGRAFEEIRDQVGQSVQEIGSFAETLNTQTAEALTTLRAVVEQIEPYRGPNR